MAGSLVTDCRPADHPWHKGISMTLSVVNDQNFWGGPTFSAGRYQSLDNVGETRHEAWRQIEAHEDSVLLAHDLTWRTAGGAPWLREQRRIRIHVSPDTSSWTMRWQMRFENISGVALRLGSPATEGRAGAGYTGLFWRGARAFQSAHVLLDDDATVRTPDACNGSAARRLCLSAQGETAVVLENLSVDDGLPITWFVRAGDYAGVAFSLAWAQAVHIPAGGHFALAHGIMVVDGAGGQPG
jgi:hypothetical protein